MTRKELEIRRDRIITEIRRMETPESLLGKMRMGPNGIFTCWPTGMPRGTNDPETAMLQREDVDREIDLLDALCRELNDILYDLESA